MLEQSLPPFCVSKISTCLADVILIQKVSCLMTYKTRFKLSKYSFLYHKEHILGNWAGIQGN